MKKENILIFADSERDADMFYAVNTFVPDPFIYMRILGVNLVIVNNLEVDRLRRTAQHCVVLSLNDLVSRLGLNISKPETYAAVISSILRSREIYKIKVPSSFPVGMSFWLARYGVKVEPAQGPIFPEREFKTQREIQYIQESLSIAEAGMAAAQKVLRSSSIDKNNILRYQGGILTAEKLRSIIETTMLAAGGLATHTIVAPGVQACDPHEEGYGPIKAHEPIIIDIFPRSKHSGYFGDITRTFIKGRAAEPAKKLYETVALAQTTAINMVKPGVRAKLIHEAVEKIFEQNGFKTGKMNGYIQGFFHSTGHALGLEIHEEPRINKTTDAVLKPGHVITIEPGLYYRDIGGVRLEDVVLVTDHGHENLTRFPKVFEV